MADHELAFEYVVEQIRSSPVIHDAFSCNIRGPGSEDIVVVKKNSIALLCKESDGEWFRKSNRELQLSIRHAACFRRAEKQDIIAITTAPGRITFISYRNGALDICHEIQTFSLTDTHLSTLDRVIKFDAKGQFMYMQAVEGQFAMYKVDDQSSDLAFSARRIFAIDGVILSCCFLGQHRGRNALVIHTTRRNSCRLALLNWQEDELLESIIPRYMPIDQSMAMCLFMLPVSKKASAAFLHVSAEQIALIYEDSLHCGDLQFSTMKLDGLIPSAITGLYYKDSDYVALMSTSDHCIHAIVLDARERLSSIELGSVGFAATSIVILEDSTSDLSTISTFLCGSNGESGFFSFTAKTPPMVLSSFLEAVPAKDFLVGQYNRHNIQNKVSTIGGIGQSSSIQSHFFGLAAYVQDEFAILEPKNTAPKQIFVLSDKYGQDFVLLSLPWSSQLLQLQASANAEVHDVGLQYGLIENVPTIRACILNECLLQITPSAIVQCFADESAESVVDNNADGETILIAEVCQNRVALFIRTETTFLLRTNTFIKTENERLEIIQQGSDMLFAVEAMTVQFLALDESDDNMLLLLCFADGRILLFRSAGEQRIILVDDTQSLVQAARYAEHDTDAIIPHSSIILFENEEFHVLVALRSGAIAHFRSEGDQVILEALLQHSRTPITFCKALKHNHEGYFLGEHLGRVALNDGELFVDSIGRSGKNPETFTCSLDPFFFPGSDTALRQAGILCLAEGVLSFNTVSNDLEDIIEVNSLGESPQRMLHDDDLGCLLVATNRVTTSPDGERGVTNMANLQIRRRQACLSSSPLRDSKKQSLIFKPGEKIYALIQWLVTINGKDRLWTVVGSSKRNTKNGKCDEGKLTVLRFKSAADKIDIRKEFSPSFPSPVYALCALGTLSLVVAHGNVLEICTLDIENRALASQTQAELRSSAIVLYTYDEYVFAATQKDSILVFRYDAAAKTLTRVATDPYPRMSVSMTVLRDSIVILTDKTKQLTIHSWDSTNAKLSLIQTISMPSVIVRTRPLTLSGKEKTGSALPDDFVLVALGLDGSLHSIFRAHTMVSRQINLVRHQEHYDFWKDHTLSDIVNLLPVESLQVLFSDSENQASINDWRVALRRALINRTRRLLAL